MASADLFLSRHAEASIWLARYMERAESLSRILAVMEWFGRDGQHGRSWYSIVRINADEERFSSLHPRATPQAVRSFYLIDQDNPTSIVASIRAARENARSLRAATSTDLWTQINVFYNFVREIAAGDVQGTNFATVCAAVRDQCQAHSGVAEGTLYRDQGWYFYQIGRYLERADQTTRLLDIKYHVMLPELSDAGSPMDVSQWQDILRSAASFGAFRRLYQRTVTPASVADFLLMNPNSPRSVAFAVRQVESHLTDMRMRFRLRGGARALETLDELRAALDDHSIDYVLAHGLHDYLDWVQARLIAVAERLADDFYGR